MFIPLEIGDEGKVHAAIGELVLVETVAAHGLSHGEGDGHRGAIVVGAGGKGIPRGSGRGEVGSATRLRFKVLDRFRHVIRKVGRRLRCPWSCLLLS